MRASLLSAAPRIPAITWEETSNACAISKAEWGRWQPSPGGIGTVGNHGYSGPGP